MATPITTIQVIPTEAFEILAEQLAERTQDNARSGYQNLGSGNNVLSMTSSANLLINGQAGNDTFQLFGTGNDTLLTGSGDDFVFAGRGNDYVSSGSGADTLIGFDGDDKLYGGSGNDTAEGGIGTDQIYGGGGNDELFGGAGVDILYGGTGNDKIYGDHDGSATLEQKRDYLYGGFGNDEIHGGGNADTMYGNAGRDTFVFDHVNDFVLGHADFIGDFSHAALEKIDLAAVDANLNRGGDQSFRMVDAPSSSAGTLWLGATANGQQHVFMNVDGGSADLEIIVKFGDADMTSLSASDFLF
jgi:Ca2+-binding RTX toxin-like protein